MTTKETKLTSKNYLVIDDLSYFKDGQIVQVKKGIEDVYLDTQNVPQDALNELVERELVKVITV